MPLGRGEENIHVLAQNTCFGHHKCSWRGPAFSSYIHFTASNSAGSGLAVSLKTIPWFQGYAVNAETQWRTAVAGWAAFIINNHKHVMGAR